MFGARRKRRQEATELVLRVTRDFLAARGIERTPTLDSRLSPADLSLDSIAALELMAEVERHSGMTIPERFWEATHQMTLGGLVDLVVKRGKR